MRIALTITTWRGNIWKKIVFLGIPATRCTTTVILWSHGEFWLKSSVPFPLNILLFLLKGIHPKSVFRWFAETANNFGFFQLWRSVRSCSHTIPEKVRNSRPINMGFKGWGWLLWWSWVTFKPFRYKKFNERVQKANFSV